MQEQCTYSFCKTVTVSSLASLRTNMNVIVFTSIGILSVDLRMFTCLTFLLILLFWALCRFWWAILLLFNLNLQSSNSTKEYTDWNIWQWTIYNLTWNSLDTAFLFFHLRFVSVWWLLSTRWVEGTCLLLLKKERFGICSLTPTM